MRCLAPSRQFIFSVILCYRFSFYFDERIKCTKLNKSASISQIPIIVSLSCTCQQNESIDNEKTDSRHNQIPLNERKKQILVDSFSLFSFCSTIYFHFGLTSFVTTFFWCFLLYMLFFIVFASSVV